MADATDWEALRDAAYRITCITRTATFGQSDDEVVAWGLLGIIPADPNKGEVNEEWLLSRGWHEERRLTWRPSGVKRISISFDGPTKLRISDEFAMVTIGWPSRMTVALFEAAAREAVVNNG